MVTDQMQFLPEHLKRDMWQRPVAAGHPDGVCGFAGASRIGACRRPGWIFGPCLYRNHSGEQDVGAQVGVAALSVDLMIFGANGARSRDYPPFRANVGQRMLNRNLQESGNIGRNHQKQAIFRDWPIPSNMTPTPTANAVVRTYDNTREKACSCRDWQEASGNDHRLSYLVFDDNIWSFTSHVCIQTGFIRGINLPTSSSALSPTERMNDPLSVQACDQELHVITPDLQQERYHPISVRIGLGISLWTYSSGRRDRIGRIDIVGIAPMGSTRIRPSSATIFVMSDGLSSKMTIPCQGR
jgi:hypothetical protein